MQPWSRFALLGASGAAHADTFLDGTHIVGKDVEPGYYQAVGGPHCTWAIMLDAKGESDTGGGRKQLVELRVGDLVFHSTRCGMWRAVSPDEIKQIRADMQAASAQLIFAALTHAIRQTADSTVADAIYLRMFEIWEGYLERPEQYGVTRAAMIDYLNALARDGTLPR